MKYKVLFISLLVLFTSFQEVVKGKKVKVENKEALKTAIINAQPGDEIILANGVWKDIQIEFEAVGTKENPIILRAETAGKVFIEGVSNLKLAGEFLIVKDLYFKNGYTPSKAVIQFKIDNERIANNCIVTNCVIDAFTQPNRKTKDHWVELWGRYNEFSHCYIAGKSNQGPTLRVFLKGNEHIKNYHKIKNNHFGPRPRMGGPHGETLQIGSSFTSMAPSYVQVVNNFFEECNGEVEVISSKSNFNNISNNVFYKSEGSLVLRHGNYCTIDGNIFIGTDASKYIGGIRVINTGHWITNNYFYKLRGGEFRAPLSVMNGIPKSPLNRYGQVTDVVVAYNSFIDCETPWHFSVGANMSKSDVLPKQEIRSARPIRTLLANNLVWNKEVSHPIKAYDKVDGVTFKNNSINHPNESEIKSEGIITTNVEINKLNAWLYEPTKNDENVYNGFDFEAIKNDLFGNTRDVKNSIGAIISPITKNR